MKRETWLRSNWRVAALLAIFPAATLAVALLMLPMTTSLFGWSFAWLSALGSLAALAGLYHRARQPRLSCMGDQLAVFLAGPRPILVPLDVVECFFLGQGPSMLPWISGGSGQANVETATLIVRLAESAAEWHHRDVNARLGQWCQGYITIRGTGCEPLHGAVVARLNQRLVEAHRRVQRAREKAAV